MFIDLLCKIWHKGLTPSNIISGFKRTGLYPLDKGKFPIERLDARFLRRYTKWVEMGKPSDTLEEASQSVETPQKLKPTPEERNDNATENSFHLQELPVNSTQITNVSITNNDDSRINNVASDSSTPKPLSVKRKEQEDKEKEEHKLERKRKAEERKEKKFEKQKAKKKIKIDYSSESDKNDVVLEEETTEEEIISDYEEERSKKNDTSDEEKINEDNDSDDPADLLRNIERNKSSNT